MNSLPHMGWTVMTHEHYVSLVKKFFSDQQVFQTCSDSDVQLIVETLKVFLLERLLPHHPFPKDSWEAKLIGYCTQQLVQLFNDNKWQLPALYGLPKLHKPILEIRPICACHSWITTPPSILLDALCRDLVTTNTIPTYLKDTPSLLWELEHTTFSKQDAKDLLLVTGDITALYPSIPT